jgi:hypothetical protein
MEAAFTEYTPQAKQTVADQVRREIPLDSADNGRREAAELANPSSLVTIREGERLSGATRPSSPLLHGL